MNYTPKHFEIGDKVTVTDIKGIGKVKYPRKKLLEPVLYLNAQHAA